ncbi:hypothetical protein SLS62_010129 [Diatrype stigma]|uniref:MYND-type domain-containing protein n=1 Tax=Diatrype stigma TaxID=117547 RepID=A0AAN9YJ02_9PEZI
MPRWGRRLFEGDLDMMIAISMIEDICDHDEANWMIADLIKCAPPEIREFYTQEHGLTPPKSDKRVQLRRKLDAGLGSDWFQEYYVRENCGCSIHATESKYKVVMVCALMMRVGAKIKPDNLRHLYELVPQIRCGDTFVPSGDYAFRGPGKAQFLAALASYRPGIPHDFHEPSCHACGQTNKDGKDLKKCGGCQNERAAAYFCDRDCQKSHWKVHKRGNCGPSDILRIGIFRVREKNRGPEYSIISEAQV